MKKLLVFVFIAFIVALIPFVFFLKNTGIFYNVKVTEKEMGPFKFVYEDHTGPYHGIKDVQDKIYNSLLGDGIETFKGFGIYYDDPKKVSQDKLRSIGGCIIEEKDYVKLESIKDKYKIKDQAKSKSIYSEFPFNNNFSILAGIVKVYPKMMSYQKQMNYNPAPVMEIYDIPNKKIQYLITIDK